MHSWTFGAMECMSLRNFCRYARCRGDSFARYSSIVATRLFIERSITNSEKSVSFYVRGPRCRWDFPWRVCTMQVWRELTTNEKERGRQERQENRSGTSAIQTGILLAVGGDCVDSHGQGEI